MDYLDFIYLNVCKSYKFCDDCLLNVFIFSLFCYVCMDMIGLIMVLKEEGEKNFIGFFFVVKLDFFCYVIY